MCARRTEVFNSARTVKPNAIAESTKAVVCVAGLLGGGVAVGIG